MSRLNVGPRIYAVMGLILFLFVVSLGAFLVADSKATSSLDRADKARDLSLRADEFIAAMELQRGLQAEYVVSPDPQILVEFEESAVRAFAIADELEAAFPDNTAITGAVARARELDEIHDPLVFDQIAPAARAGNVERARELLPEATALIIEFVEQGSIARDAVRAEAVEARSDARDALAFAKWLLLIMGGTALVAGGALSVLLVRSVVRPLVRMRDTMTEVGATGDLRARADDKRSDEIGDTARAFNGMLEQISSIIGRVRRSAHGLTSSSHDARSATESARHAYGEVAATVEAVATGATTQATALQNTRETFSQIESEVGQVAERSRAASEAARSADGAAATGLDALSEAGKALSAIEESVSGAAEVVTQLGARSEAIGEIVETISGIAEQTNLLALNAAIEAARAGDQGRGFAVVADEVRQLAENSQESVSMIESIIREIQESSRNAVDAMGTGTESVKLGSERMEATGHAFDEIQQRVSEVTDEVAKVATAAEHLAQGSQTALEGLTEAVSVSEENAASAEEMSASTEETAASAEVVTQTAEQVSGYADDLDRLVQGFTVDEDEQAGAEGEEPEA